MKVVDLTHTLRENMPVFPGTEPPKIIDGNTIERDGFAEKILTFYTHTGTHIDAISLDRMEDEDLPVHRILLEREFIFIENLKNLEKLVGKTFTLSCLPLRFEGADGAPVRAVALLK